MATVTGVSDHIGWAELVILGEGPTILDRRRVELVAPGLPSAPYHHEALELPIDEAERVVGRTSASVTTHCRRVMEFLKSSFGVDAVVIQESPYDALPDSLSEILASRPLTNAADGMLYREELANQAAAVGLRVHRFPRKTDPVSEASRVLGCGLSQLETTLSNFGKSVGAPWRKEHRHVAAAALRVLFHDTASRK